MVNTKILVSIVIVLLIGIAAASYQMTTDSPGLWQPTTSQEQTSDSNTQSEQTQSGTQDGTTSGDSQSGDGGNNVKISSAEAKSIAQQSIEEPGATAGTPELKTVNGEQIYVVPVVKDNKKIGEIWVDPETGENIGGAGGAP